jgi:hypothetical protein
MIIVIIKVSFVLMVYIINILIMLQSKHMNVQSLNCVSYLSLMLLLRSQVIRLVPKWCILFDLGVANSQLLRLR